MGSAEVEGTRPSSGVNRLLLFCFQLLNLICILNVRTFSIGCLPFSEQTPSVPKIECELQRGGIVQGVSTQPCLWPKEYGMLCPSEFWDGFRPVVFAQSSSPDWAKGKFSADSASLRLLLDLFTKQKDSYEKEEGRKAFFLEESGF